MFHCMWVVSLVKCAECFCFFFVASYMCVLKVGIVSSTIFRGVIFLLTMLGLDICIKAHLPLA